MSEEADTGDAGDLHAAFAALRADADGAAVPAFEVVMAGAAARARQAALAARRRRVWAAASLAIVAVLAFWSSERPTVPSTLAMPPWQTPTDRLVSSLRASTSVSWASLPTAGLESLPPPRSGEPR